MLTCTSWWALLPTAFFLSGGVKIKSGVTERNGVWGGVPTFFQLTRDSTALLSQNLFLLGLTQSAVEIWTDGKRVCDGGQGGSIIIPARREAAQT